MIPSFARRSAKPRLADFDFSVIAAGFAGEIRSATVLSVGASCFLPVDFFRARHQDPRESQCAADGSLRTDGTKGAYRGVTSTASTSRRADFGSATT